MALTGVGGINRLNKHTGLFMHFLEGIRVNQLYKDSEGTIWAGTEKGLYRYDKESDRFSPFFDPQSDIDRGNYRRYD